MKQWSETPLRSFSTVSLCQKLPLRHTFCLLWHKSHINRWETTYGEKACIKDQNVIYLESAEASWHMLCGVCAASIEQDIEKISTLATEKMLTHNRTYYTHNKIPYRTVWVSSGQALDCRKTCCYHAENVCNVNITTSPDFSAECWSVVGQWAAAGSVSWVQEGDFLEGKWENNASGFSVAQSGQWSCELESIV